MSSIGRIAELSFNGTTRGWVLEAKTGFGVGNFYDGQILLSISIAKQTLAAIKIEKVQIG